MWNDNFDFLIHSQLVFRAPVWTKKLYLSSTIDLLIMYILKSNMYLCVCVCVYRKVHKSSLFINQTYLHNQLTVKKQNFPAS